MINNDFNDLALFKFQIIAPVINNTHGFSSNEEYFKHASNKSYSFNNKELKFSKSCIKSWYLSYKKNGFQSLQKKTRKESLITILFEELFLYVKNFLVLLVVLFIKN